MKVVIILLAFILPMPSFACSCLMTDFSDAGSENNIDMSSFIFEGKVLSVTPIIVEEGAFEDNGITRAPPPHENNYFSEIKVEIKQLYKGLRDVETLTAYY